MDKSIEEQNKAIKKALIELRKRTAMPKPALDLVEEYFNYLYSIGYKKGLYTEDNSTKNIALYNYLGLIEIFPDVKTIAKYLGVSENFIRSNLAGGDNQIIKNNKIYQARYTRNQPTILTIKKRSNKTPL